MKIFLAMPYSQLCDETYTLKDEYKTYFEKLINNLEEMGCEYFLAHKRENWGKEYNLDTESTQIDFDTIKECDLVCMVPGVPYSGGVHVELGWASAFKRKVRLFLKKDYPYSPMVTGVKCLTDTKYYYYDDDFSEDLFNMIIDSVREELGEVNG